MPSMLRTTDPILLETHIKNCLTSLRDGAVFSALLFGGLMLLCVAGGSSITSMLPACLFMFLILIPFCQIWVRVLRRGIHLPSFSFWGNIEFVLIGYLLQFTVKVLIYIGTPLIMLTFAASLVEQLGDAFFLAALFVALSWPLIIFGYVHYQRKRLAELVGNCGRLASTTQDA